MEKTDTSYAAPGKTYKRHVPRVITPFNANDSLLVMRGTARVVVVVVGV